MYGILFAIVFAETGLVICPFLPGDSLLFSTAALAAAGRLSIAALSLVFVAAAVLGDGVNYLGAWLRMCVALSGMFIRVVCPGASFAAQSTSLGGALSSVGNARATPRLTSPASYLALQSAASLLSACSSLGLSDGSTLPRRSSFSASTAAKQVGSVRALVALGCQFKEISRLERGASA